MELEVHNARGVIDLHNGRNYEVQPSGALVIDLESGGQVAYSPVGWLSIEAPAY